MLYIFSLHNTNVTLRPRAVCASSKVVEFIELIKLGGIAKMLNDPADA
jgi:hypothetical protein